MGELMYNPLDFADDTMEETHQFVLSRLNGVTKVSTHLIELGEDLEALLYVVESLKPLTVLRVIWEDDREKDNTYE